MSHKASRIVFVSLFLMALVALSIPALAADNATITGDRVRLRDIPSIWGEAEYHFDKGTRVEVIARTDFTDTIEGRTAPWYKLGQSNWVFGGFVALDPGADVPTVSLVSGDPGITSRFIIEGLYAFGKTRSEVTEKLGPPLSVEKETHESVIAPGELLNVYVLSYDGVVIESLEYNDDPGCIASTTYTTDAYDLGGLRVGSPASDVERILGPQCEKQVDKVSFGCMGQAYHVLEITVDDRLYIGVRGCRRKSFIFPHEREDL